MGLLELRMVTSVNSKKIYYEKSGRGMPVLLVHGWGGTNKSLELLGNLLAKKYTVIRPDLPGFGQSENPDSDWGVGEYARFLVEFMQKIVNVQLPISNKQKNTAKQQKIIYIGHSFGGTLGIYLAANYPQLIDRLVLLAPSFKRGERRTSSYGRLLKNFPVLKKFIYKTFFRRSDLPKYPHLEPNFRKIVTEDLTPSASKITIPTLIIWGSDDRDVPREHGQLLHKEIKNSRLKVFEGTRHGLPLKHPDLVFTEIDKFLS